MKKSYYYSALLICLAGSMTLSCTKREEKKLVHTGKIVKSMCGHVAIQFTDNSGLGMSEWTDPMDSVTYTNVFTVGNPCTAGYANVGNSVRFIMVSHEEQNCVQCLAYTPTPDLSYNIRIID